jgi:hypothetical protein
MAVLSENLHAIPFAVRLVGTPKAVAVSNNPQPAASSRVLIMGINGLQFRLSAAQ